MGELRRIDCSSLTIFGRFGNLFHVQNMSDGKAENLERICRLKDLTTEELHLRLAPMGVPIALTRQVQIAALRQGTLPERLPGHSSKLLRAIGQVAEIPHLVLLEKLVSQDGFTKYLFRGEDSEPFEAVRIPLLHRPQDPKYVVCVSSQVGCGLGCAFCATGRLGFRRNLATWEIVQPGGEDPRRLDPSGRRRGLHGYGGTDAQLRPRPAGGQNPQRSLWAGDLRQGDHHFHRRRRAGYPPLHRRATSVPIGCLADLGRSRLPGQADADREGLPARATDGSRAGVSSRQRPAGDPGLDHDLGHEYPAGRLRKPWPD